MEKIRSFLIMDFFCQLYSRPDKGWGLWFLSILEFLSDRMGIACTMKEPDDCNLVCFHGEVDSVRKPSEETTPKVMMDFCVKQRIPRNLSSTGVKYPKEFLAEPS
jgi:hypothetical protein